MKLFILCMALVLAAVEVKSDKKEELRNVEKVCREENNITEEELQSAVKSGFKEEPREALKCYMKCILEKLGQWKNGAFEENVAKKFLQDIPALKDHQDIIEKTLNECKIQKGVNECDTAYLISKCFMERNPRVM
uniref:Odorant binding protein n=1 Tax=Calliphora stygia TaxID=145453 RepID=A0A068FBQ3_CALSG|nr:odorant binding protein [Calliphora stygia]